jgi:hypothetical protein
MDALVLMCTGDLFNKDGMSTLSVMLKTNNDSVHY